MKVTEFTGHVTMMRADAEFYGAEDLIGRGDVPMQIEKVLECTNRKVGGKVKPLCFTLKFVGGEKELVLNATNRQMLTHMYGPNAQNWKGQWVWCYVEQCQSTKGGMTLGVRFRDRKDAPKQEAQEPRTQPKPVQSEAQRLREALIVAEKDKSKRVAQFAEWGIVDPRNDDEFTPEKLEMMWQWIEERNGSKFA